ncbi:3-deoxy-manno-octulosonate cytidylyltransferase (CMP-KDO synthetase) [Acidovorax sp. 106]|nr:3-deoxy-manno-octulosonate cytidylyltransferase (CMP-KDO synthetase) [Acidovorax sp. 106]
MSDGPAMPGHSPSPAAIGAATPFTVLIPARLASSRLPNKPLADIAGTPMVVRVAQRAQQSQAQRVVVAADDDLILQACQQHGIEAVLTDKHHASGSDRLAQACEQLGLQGDDIVVNVQGDEPLIDPALINAVAGLLAAQAQASMGTAAHPIASREDYLNPNVVKVVLDAQGLAYYFSRAPIPWSRDHSNTAWWDAATQSPVAHSATGFSPLRHVGIYSYRAGFLRQFPQLPVAPTEAVEALEQLRALWHGHRIAVHIAATAPGPGVDTPEDLAKVRALLAPANPRH